MSVGLPGVALYVDDLSVLRRLLSAQPDECLNARKCPPPATSASHTAGMDDQRARELLAGERARIEHALGRLEREQSEPDDVPDPLEASDVGQDMFDNELDEAEDERLRGELEAVERAEQRLVEGAYGLSVESGQPIPDARLEAIPWAERTAAEQTTYEATGG